MSLIHDAYLFRPEEFAKAIAPLVQTTEPGSSRRIVNYVLELFDHSDSVRALAVEYGSWTKLGLEELLALVDLEDPHEIGFWVMFMLYDYIYSKPEELGLGSSWQSMEGALRVLRWHEDEIKLLVHGRPLVEIAECLVSKVSNPEMPVAAFWAELLPNSTCAEAGWLDVSDIEPLQHHLQVSQSVLSGLPLRLSEANTTKLFTVFESALKMLEAAKQAQTGLLLIIGG